MSIDVKRAISDALATSREHFGLTSSMENISHYTDPSIPARACSLWMQANREALQYSGPTREVLQRDKEQAEKALAAARPQLQAAQLALVHAYPSAFAAGAVADVNMEIDMSLVSARDTAQRHVSAAQGRLREAEAGLHSLAVHEAAVAGLVRVLSALVGKEAR